MRRLAGVGSFWCIPSAVTVTLATATIALCSSCFLPTGCDTVLGISYYPVDTTIRVGESFRPRMNLTNCGGTRKVSAELRYSTDDTSIVQVDFDGKITGRAVGHTTAYVNAYQYGIVAPILVTVR